MKKAVPLAQQEYLEFPCTFSLRVYIFLGVQSALLSTVLGHYKGHYQGVAKLIPTHQFGGGEA